MYVMSSLPRHQQSVAGGIFNTVTKLCNTIGLGITTAIFTSTSSASAQHPSASNESLKPYLACFWFSCASAGLSILLVPFLTIGTQGGKFGGGEDGRGEKGDIVEKKRTELGLGSEDTDAVGSMIAVAKHKA